MVSLSSVTHCVMFDVVLLPASVGSTRQRPFLACYNAPLRAAVMDGQVAEDVREATSSAWCACSDLLLLAL